MPARKIELTPGNVKKYIDLHYKLKLPFEMTISNYTTELKSRVYELRFMKNAQSNRTFSAFQKVRTDCVKKFVPVIDPTTVNYFATNIFKTDFYADVIYNVDLKAAYATVLFNDGYISEPTYKMIMTLPKMERLASVGMLAGKKNIFQISAEGKVLEDTTIISPTADYFFYCVQRTHDIMNDARMILHENFLFSWVDGIYFLDNENRNYSELMQYFEQKKFNVSFEVLKEFHVINKKSIYVCSYWKGDKKKIMNVPKQQNSIIKNLSNYLLTKNY